MPVNASHDLPRFHRRCQSFIPVIWMTIISDAFPFLRAPPSHFHIQLNTSDSSISQLVSFSSGSLTSGDPSFGQALRHPPLFSSGESPPLCGMCRNSPVTRAQSNWESGSFSFVPVFN